MESEFCGEGHELKLQAEEKRIAAKEIDRKLSYRHLAVMEI